MNEIKRILFDFQIEYYKKYYSVKLNDELSSPISAALYNARIQMYNGRIYALTIDYTDLYDTYNLCNKKLIKCANKTDDFWYYTGVVNTCLLMMTVPENSLSACPKNKNILLKREIDDLENKLKTTLGKKDEIKINLNIVKKLYENNLKLLQHETTTI